MTENKNFCGQVTPSIIDIEYERCNFAHKNCIDDGQKKGVRIFPGDDTPRTFRNCNLTNCELPPNSTTVSCTTAILESCAYVDSDTVEIDSEVIEVKNYATIIYGNYRDGEYIYRSAPVVIPCKPPEEN